jgi:hypothetical protein
MDQQFFVPINRDRGAAYVAYTGHPDLEVVQLQFLERYGFEPDEVFEEFGITFVGPTPDRVLEDDLHPMSQEGV